MWRFEEGEVCATFHNSVNEMALTYMEELEAPLVMPEVDYCIELEDYALTTEFVCVYYFYVYSNCVIHVVSFIKIIILET